MAEPPRASAPVAATLNFASSTAAQVAAVGEEEAGPKISDQSAEAVNLAPKYSAAESTYSEAGYS